MFLVGQNFSKLDLLFSPVGAVHVEHLGHRAPTDIFHERGFFIFCRRTLLGIKRPQRLNGFEILLKLLLRSAFTEPVGFGEAVVVEILRRFFLVATMAVVRPVAGC